ncbi:MAG: protein-disulfide isomerase [Brevundimonas sp.]|jgi:protein-disulfide isomerase|uniref:DsbA family protein n=1 Tax=Brevundimonas sp. TaxID=1871086 RepID=UPI0039E62E7A
MRPTFLNRRAAMIAAVGATLALAACGGSGTGAPAEGDMAKGAGEDAAVTVVEYASVTCGVCAAWNEQVKPEFEERYVDNNRVRFVFRELPTPPQDIAVAGFLLARCAGDDRYFEVVDQIMRSQREWQQGVSPRESLLRIAANAGLSEEEFTQCVTDEDAILAMDERVQAAQRAGVTGTPYFTVNGQHVSDSSLEGLSAVIDPLLEAEG